MGTGRNLHVGKQVRGHWRIAEELASAKEKVQLETEEQRAIQEYARVCVHVYVCEWVREGVMQLNLSVNVPNRCTQFRYGKLNSTSKEDKRGYDE